MGIIFLGSNPPEGSRSDTPFEGCRSGVRLAEWIQYLGLKRSEYTILNVSNVRTPGNRALSAAEIKAALPALSAAIAGKYVICLGKTAAKAMKRAGTASGYFELPHPSEGSRMINHRQLIERELDRLKDILYPDQDPYNR